MFRQLFHVVCSLCIRIIKLGQPIKLNNDITATQLVTRHTCQCAYVGCIRSSAAIICNHVTTANETVNRWRLIAQQSYITRLGEESKGKLGISIEY